MQVVKTESGHANSFFDDGSTCCLILYSAADRLGLIGEDVTLKLETVNCDEFIQSKLFCIDLIDNAGEKHTIKAFGVQKISGGLSSVDLSDLKDLFSHSTQESWSCVENRPTGDVEILIGANFLGLHPSDHETVGNIKIKTSMFGSGLVAVGSHPSIKSSPLVWDATVSSIRTMKVNHVRLTYKSVRDYLESSDLTVLTPRRCGNCMKCEECSFIGHQMSLQGQYEYKVMGDNVHYEEASKSSNQFLMLFTRALV